MKNQGKASKKEEEIDSQSKTIYGCNMPSPAVNLPWYLTKVTQAFKNMRHYHFKHCWFIIKDLGAKSSSMFWGLINLQTWRAEGKLNKTIVPFKYTLKFPTEELLDFSVWPKLTLLGVKAQYVIDVHNSFDNVDLQFKLDTFLERERF